MAHPDLPVVLRLLGPVTVLDPTGAAVEVGSPRHREVLAALAVDVGRAVSVDTLLARVWGDSTRGGTVASLQAVISRLRSRFRDAGVAARIVTAPPGYLLEVSSSAVDVVRLTTGIEAARRAVATSDVPMAQVRDQLNDTLAHWRGAPFADVPQQFARTEAARLEGLRLTGEELAADLDLRLGDATEAIARLQALSSHHPMRESLREQLMRALYLGGRQADALAEYEAARLLLTEELGVDPGPALRRMQQRILAHDPELRPASRATAPTGDAATVPAPRTGGGAAAVPLPRAVSNLPATDLLGALVGRERDVSYLADLLQQPTSRLVTITGVGGCGKTRLALAVAERAAPAFAFGSTLVPLAPLTTPDAVIPAIARAVGVAEGGDPFGALLELFRDRQQLLLLDNAEHLLDAWPELATLAAACPGLRLLVTSRIPLQVRGEVLFPLAPLDLAASTHLFVARAANVRPGERLDAGDPVIHQLCQRLAGIPLAIELAAARVRMLNPATILDRLAEVMAAEGARDLPPRQRTMRAAIDWSFALLSETEQAVFPRLAVFSGGFTIDAAIAVLADVVAPDEVLAVAEGLVNQSLLVAEETLSEPRFRLLEPVAQYALTRLAEDDETEARNAHLAYFTALAARYEPSLRGPGTVQTLASLESEQANMVAAIEWSLRSGQPDQGGWLGWHLWLFWWVRGTLRDGRRLMQQLLDTTLDDRVRVRVGAVTGALAFAQGDLAGARVWESAAALAEEIGDAEGLPYAVGGTGLIALAQEDLPQAAAIHQRTIALCTTAGLDGEWLWTLSHVWLGTIELLRGNPSQASDLVDLALAAGRQRDDPLAVYIALFTAVQISLTLGDTDRARAQIAEGVALSASTGDHANLAYLLESLAVVESIAGDLARVGTLRGAASELRASVGGNVYGYYRPDESLIADAEARAVAARGAAQYADDLAAGVALPLAQMAALTDVQPR
ncbi:AfsR/SARP family transcriptional regulator [Nocardioides sp. Bht2]|uniref:AfsR/SARP family transcriptional regulator n=1 Tax=Nocardioides sp. Bht2 TaxID=3392297 RepID=UPI0039B6B713